MLNHLIEIFGKENVSTDELDRLVYSYDSSQMKGSALAVVWPESYDQLKKLILFANRTNHILVPRGAGSGLVGGAIPFDSIVVDFSKMNRIIRIDLKKKEALVEPGVVLDELNKLLRGYGLMFPINPSSHSICQIGGMVATNAVGSKALKYGRTADWVKGLEIIDGTGKVIEPKNFQEFIGTEGTVCFFTKIRLQLADYEELKSISVLKFNNYSELLKTIQPLRSQGNVVMIEFFDKLTAKLAGLINKHHIIVGYLDEEGEITDSAQIKQTLNQRDTLSSVLTSLGYDIKEDPQVYFEKLEVFLKWLYNHNIPVFGHIGIGLLHPRFRQVDKEIITKMFSKVAETGGKVTGEHGIGITKKEFVYLSYKNKIRQLKEKYDPNDTINSGKIL